jgi:PhoH-like ATPase
MQKIYVIDTNVILMEAESILKFEENIVIIPQPVLNELDKKKKETGEIGYNARKFSRIVDELRTKGNLANGVPCNDQGGMLYITLFDENVAACLPYQDMCVMDNRILASALYAKKFFGITLGHQDYELTMVSNDTNVRILADIFDIKAEDYKNDKIQTDDLFSGIQHIDIPQEDIDRIYQQGMLDLLDMQINEPYPNECFVFHSTSNTKQSALACYNAVMKEFRLLPQDMKTVDILPRNAEQSFALNILKDDDIKLVTLTAKAGCGKTMIALAAGLHGVMVTHKYSKILLLKPIVPMDNSHELGFLPGGLDEKLGPWMASYGDNIEQIMALYMKDDDDGLSANKRKKSQKEKDVLQEKSQGKLSPVQELIAQGMLEFGSLEHARGRNWSNTYIIIDEGQNTSKNTAKTVITRVGEGSKIVFMGDISQIDSPYLDSKNNGLAIVQNLWKDQKIAAHITLTKSERSELAEIASEIMK